MACSTGDLAKSNGGGVSVRAYFRLDRSAPKMRQPIHNCDLIHTTVSCRKEENKTQEVARIFRAREGDAPESALGEVLAELCPRKDDNYELAYCDRTRRGCNHIHRIVFVDYRARQKEVHGRDAMLLPLSKLRNHTQFCADFGEQVAR
jgi:hypothetical protein